MQFIKHLIGTAVVFADILFGIAAPQIIKSLHHEKGSHLYGSLAVYAVLAVLTLWVIVSVVRGVADRTTPKPAPAAPRTGGYPFRGGL